MKRFEFESSPLRFIILSLLVFGFAIVTTYVLPYNNSKQIKPDPTTVSYTALQLTGRAIYIREGCEWCHSQVVRDIEDNELTIFRSGDIGPITDPSLYVNQNPLLLGQHRRGPDLSHVWSRWPSETWQIEHLTDPQGLNPGTWMPPFSYLSNNDLNALAAYLKTLK